jgi:hypothetical protein
MPRSRRWSTFAVLVTLVTLALAPAAVSAAPFNGGGITALAKLFFPNPVVTSGNLG